MRVRILLYLLLGAMGIRARTFSDSAVLEMPENSDPSQGKFKTFEELQEIQFELSYDHDTFPDESYDFLVTPAEEPSLKNDTFQLAINRILRGSDVPPSAIEKTQIKYGMLPEQIVEYVVTPPENMMMNNPPSPTTAFLKDVPMQGGMSISFSRPGRYSKGTLGGFIVSNLDNTVFGITNAHVLPLNYNDKKHAFEAQEACVPAEWVVREDHEMPASGVARCSEKNSEMLERLVGFDNEDEEEKYYYNKGRCVDEPGRNCTKQSDCSRGDNCDYNFFRYWSAIGPVNHCCNGAGDAVYNSMVYHGGHGSSVRATEHHADGASATRLIHATGNRSSIMDVAAVRVSDANYAEKRYCFGNIDRAEHLRRPFKCASLIIGNLAGHFSEDSLLGYRSMNGQPGHSTTVKKTGDRTLFTTGRVIAEEMLQGFYSLNKRTQKSDGLKYRQYHVRGNELPSFDATGADFGPEEAWEWQRPREKYGATFDVPAREPTFYETEFKYFTKYLKAVYDLNAWVESDFLNLYKQLHAKNLITMFSASGDSGSFVVHDRKLLDTGIAGTTHEVLGLHTWGYMRERVCRGNEDDRSVVIFKGLKVCGLDKLGIYIDFNTVLKVLQRDADNGVIGTFRKKGRSMAEKHPGFRVCDELERVAHLKSIRDPFEDVGRMIEDEYFRDCAPNGSPSEIREAYLKMRHQKMTMSAMLASDFQHAGIDASESFTSTASSPLL